MPETHLPPPTVNAALLLIEPDALRYSERANQLAQSRFRITRADDVRDLYLMRNVFDFSVAVLSDRIGIPALRASAQLVRKQWSKARIVLLGRAPNQFEDHLYDESVTHAADGDTFLEVLTKLTEEAWDQQSQDTYAAWLVRTSDATRPKQSRGIQESDPKKSPGMVRQAGHARDWPAIEQVRAVARLR